MCSILRNVRIPIYWRDNRASSDAPLTTLRVEPVENVENGDSGPLPVSEIWTQISALVFDGGRFSDHSLELDVLTELVHFQRMITDLASELWRRDNPKRKNLPPNFAQTTKLRFRNICEGSTLLPMEAREEAGDTLFGSMASPFVTRAINLIHDTILSQERNVEMPPDFPRSQMIPLLCRWGSSLRDDESITVSSTRPPNQNDVLPAARFSSRTRESLKKYLDSTFENAITVYGEIRMVDRDSLKALVRMPDRSRIEVKFQKMYEDSFLRFLNKEESVAITGLAVLSAVDGFVDHLSSVTDFISIDQRSRSDRSIGSWLQANRNRVDWTNIPDSTAVDDDLYGGA